MQSQDHKVLVAINGTDGAAGATAINGAIVDMDGYQGILMIAQFGPIVATAVTSIKAQQDTDPAMGTAADLAGTAQTVAVADANKTFVIEIERAAERYLRLVVSRATANATVAAIYVLYRGRKKPAAQVAATLIERFTTPAEGTA